MKLIFMLVFSLVLLGCKTTSIKELSTEEQTKSDELIFALGAFQTLTLNFRGCQEQNKTLTTKYGNSADTAYLFSKSIEQKLVDIYGESDTRELSDASLNMAMQKVYARIQNQGHTEEYCDSKADMVLLDTMPKLLKATVIKYGINQSLQEMSHE